MSTPQPSAKSKWLPVSPLSLSSPPPPSKKIRLDDDFGHTPLDEYSTPHDRDGSPVSVLGMRFSPGSSPCSLACDSGTGEGWHSAYKGPTMGRARSRRSRGVKKMWSSGVVSDMLAYPADGLSGVEQCLEEQLFGAAGEFQSYLTSDDDHSNAMDTELEQSLPLLLSDLPLTLSTGCLEHEDELAQLQQHGTQQTRDGSRNPMDASSLRRIPSNGGNLVPSSSHDSPQADDDGQLEREAAGKKAQKGSKKVRVSRPPSSQAEGGAPRSCTHCRATDTPQWRAGPQGPKTLCNACGVRYKSGRLCDEYRPANSPEYQPDKHSNSHRKIVEMRRIRETMGLSEGEGQEVAEVVAKLSFRTIKVKLSKPQASGSGEGEGSKPRVRKEKTEEERLREKELRKERKKLRMALLKQQQQQQEQQQEQQKHQQQNQPQQQPITPQPVALGSSSFSSSSLSSPSSHGQPTQHSCLAPLSTGTPTSVSASLIPPAQLPALPPAVLPASSPLADALGAPLTAGSGAVTVPGTAPGSSGECSPADSLSDVLQLLHGYAPGDHCDANLETLPTTDLLTPAEQAHSNLPVGPRETAPAPAPAPAQPSSSTASKPAYLPSVCNMAQPPPASILAASA